MSNDALSINNDAQLRVRIRALRCDELTISMPTPLLPESNLETGLMLGHGRTSVGTTSPILHQNQICYQSTLTTLPFFASLARNSVSRVRSCHLLSRKGNGGRKEGFDLTLAGKKAEAYGRTSAPGSRTAVPPDNRANGLGMPFSIACLRYENVWLNRYGLPRVSVWSENRLPPPISVGCIDVFRYK